MVFPRRSVHICYSFTLTNIWKVRHRNLAWRLWGRIVCFLIFCVALWACWSCDVKRPSKQTFRALPLHTEQSEWTEGDILRLILNDTFTQCPHTTSFVGPYSYTPLSRTPCWQDGYLFRCVPSFYIAGFTRDGGLELYRRLTLHHEVISGITEPHWFDFWRNMAGNDSIDAYTRSFHNGSLAVSQDIVENGRSEKQIGDITSTTAWFSFYWLCYYGNERHQMEPLYTNADVIYKLNPAAKVIFILRNPADTLYLQYQTLVSGGSQTFYQDASPLEFHRLALRTVQTYKQCFCERTMRSCAYNGTLLSHMMLGLPVGMYSIFLQDWLAVFPRKQLLFIKYEDYIADIASGLQATVEFLGLEDPGIWWYADNSGQQEVDMRSHGTVGLMLTETRTLLTQFFRSVNTHLPNLLDDPRFYW